jgi:subtilisin family serine protease
MTDQTTTVGALRFKLANELGRTQYRCENPEAAGAKFVNLSAPQVDGAAWLATARVECSNATFVTCSGSGGDAASALSALRADLETIADRIGEQYVRIEVLNDAVHIALDSLREALLPAAAFSVAALDFRKVEEAATYSRYSSTNHEDQGVPKTTVTYLKHSMKYNAHTAPDDMGLPTLTTHGMFPTATAAVLDLLKAARKYAAEQHDVIARAEDNLRKMRYVHEALEAATQEAAE